MNRASQGLLVIARSAICQGIVGPILVVDLGARSRVDRGSVGNVPFLIVVAQPFNENHNRDGFSETIEAVVVPIIEYCLSSIPCASSCRVDELQLGVKCQLSWLGRCYSNYHNVASVVCTI